LEHWVKGNQTDDYVFHAASWMPWTLGQPSAWKSILICYCLDLFIPGENFVHLVASEEFFGYSFLVVLHVVKLFKFIPNCTEDIV